MPLIRVEPTGETFEAGPDQDILTAGLRHGVDLDYGCRHGNCSSCRHLLVEGAVRESGISPYALSAADRAHSVLLCSSFALVDLVIRRPHSLAEDSGPVIAPQRRRARVERISRLTPVLRELRVILDEALPYAGQYAELEVPGTAQRRSYTIANPPDGSRSMTFVVKRLGGLFSGLLDELEPDDEIGVWAPFGKLVRRESSRPALLIGIGAGISPLLCIVRDAVRRQDQGSFQLWYGARCEADLPFREELAAHARDLTDFDVRYTLSRPGRTWDGRVGRVTHAVGREIADASGFDAYVCGSPEMCRAMSILLAAKGLPESRICAERFFAAV